MSDASPPMSICADRPPALTLFNYVRSSASYRVRIALNLKGMTPARVVDLDIRAGQQKTQALLDVIPHGLVPAMSWADGSLTQSLAIIEWLDELNPAPLPLIPHDPTEAAHVREIALTIACDIHPLNNLRVLNYLVDELGVSDEAKQRWYRHWVEEGFAAVERLLARRRSSHRFALSDQPTLADICIVPQVFNARRFDVDLSPYPNIASVAANCDALEAFDQAKPR